MLFAQIIAFILVMVVFEAFQPGRPEMSTGETYLASVAMLALLYVGARLAVSILNSRILGPHPPRDPARAARRLVTQLHAAAIVALLIMFTVLELKYRLMQLPGMATWETLRGLVALGLYLLLLRVVWSAAHKVESAGALAGLDRRAYVSGQFRLVVPVVLPWLAVSLLRDILVHIWPSATAWLDSGLGNLAYLVAFIAGLAVLFPPLVRSVWGCQPLPPGRERQVIETVLEHTGVKVGGILSWPLMGGRLLTAGVLGLISPLRYVLVTPALAQALDSEELAAVMAHEAGHVRYHHLWYYLLFFMGFFLIAYALAGPASLLMSAVVWWLAGSGWGIGVLSDKDVGGAMSILMALPLLALLIVYLRFVMGFFMRHFERQADFFALDTMGEARPLVSSLERIAMLSGDTRNVPSWHHFSIAQRVEVLQEAQARPALIREQAGLIRRAAGVFTLCLALIVAGGLGMDSLGWEESIRRATLERVVRHELSLHPHNARLHLNLGIIFYEQGQERRAIAQLRQALALAPRDAEVLNGLAWVLATAKDPALRNPSQALALAQKAVSLSPKPHIWDTLAEAYFVAGRPRRAEAAARAAIAAGPRDRQQYYQDQLERFQRAARGQRP